jgi:hypothetical protein
MTIDELKINDFISPIGKVFNPIEDFGFNEYIMSSLKAFNFRNAFTSTSVFQ